VNNILVIDDNEIDGMITEKMLESYLDANVSRISPTKISLDKLTNHLITDLIIIEANLPLNLAWSFLEDLERKGTMIPTYIISCLHFKADIDRALKFQFVCGFITKPILKKDIEKLALNYGLNIV